MNDEWKVAPGNEDNHYEGTIQPMEFIEGKNLGFVEGNVIKYISRHKKKAGKLDLGKALWYLNRLLDKTDGKEYLTEDHSVKAFVESQKFSQLEAAIINKFMDYMIYRRTADLYQVRDMIKTLSLIEYGND